MLFTLTVTEDYSYNYFKKIKNHFKKQTVCTTNSVDGIQVKNIEYRCANNKKIRWKKILKHIEKQNCQIICSNNFDLPNNVGVKRFTDRKLIHRICENAVLSFLDENKFAPKKLNITLIDKNGNYSQLAERLIMYTNSLTVVTNNTDLYCTEAKRIVYEKGAPIFIVKNYTGAKDSHIIVSPERIEIPINTAGTSVIFTGDLPTHNISGIVLHGYAFNLPDKYRQLCPQQISTEDLACALYSIKNVYSIGETVPHGYISSGIEYTNESLYKHINSIINH